MNSARLEKWKLKKKLRSPTLIKPEPCRKIIARAVLANSYFPLILYECLIGSIASLGSSSYILHKTLLVLASALVPPPSSRSHGPQRARYPSFITPHKVSRLDPDSYGAYSSLFMRGADRQQEIGDTVEG